MTVSLKQNLIQGGVSHEAIVLLSNSLPSVPTVDTPTTTSETEYVDGFHEKRTASSESSDESGFRGLHRGSEDPVWDNTDTLSEDEGFLPDVPSWSQERLVKEKSSPEDTPEHPDRVKVSWNLRQYHLSGMVAWRIKNGGARNLVIRGYRHEKSEKAIRDDLDHIHNLVVIKVEFNKGGCYISTNSVFAASFAKKTCMMSRLKYKGCRIDFAPDECAQPLERTTPSQCSIPPRLDGAKDFANGNRFALLDIAGF
ncbi:uncharacterized protein J7T54_002801 [Emericellopsis cladophorae]|uniref:Uncharacterized protein n=1 Tax=Emericellopsis cladophorae TaxID=2686198 RepID=A0A9P9XX91_9HYPO|nr:uncharacterized protein J7T54_002801 [Emericellopsis cladophorae]KAI6779533.1 hypothetical protein J7T54_002801 [Emericellopsis cladophorae]